MPSRRRKHKPCPSPLACVQQAAYRACLAAGLLRCGRATRPTTEHRDRRADARRRACRGPADEE